MKPGELKPCPFCGCLPLGRNVGWTEGDRFRVECVSEECNVLPATHPAETPAIAAHWWNTRICRRRNVSCWVRFYGPYHLGQKAHCEGEPEMLEVVEILRGPGGTASVEFAGGIKLDFPEALIKSKRI